MERRPRADLSPRGEDPRRPRHRGERADHGVRQQGRRLGHRRRVHPRPRDGREPALRRLPRQRAGRRRRRRHPRHRVARGDGRRLPRVAREAARHDAAPRAALPRHVRHRVHRRAGQVVHAPGARGQAHRRGCAQDRRRHGAGGAHRRARGGAAHRAGPARPAPAPAVRSRGEVRRDHQGPQRVAGRGGRQGVLHPRRRRGAPRGRRRSDPRAPRDVARRHPRHDRGRGHPHVAGRLGEPRRARWRVDGASPRCAARTSSTSTSPAAASR